MDDAKMTVFLNEMRDENHISPFREDSEFIAYMI